jgi:hypothetical protein
MSAVCTGASLSRSARHAISWTAVLCFVAPYAMVQTAPYERTFPQSKAVVEKVLKELQSAAAGRLPILDGFATPGDRALDRFQRGYYQCTAEVDSLPSGGSRVQVSAKITAWYSDPAGSRSGYQVLPSNGRLESDFLDRLQEALLRFSAAKTSSAPSAALKSEKKTEASTPTISAPVPQDKVPGEPISPSGSNPSSASPFATRTPADELASLPARKPVAEKNAEELTKEAKSLEEIVRNQSHPNNLVAVKKSGTPVLGSPNEGAKVLFLATAEDEFEMLDMNASWVHIRISGLSRGWIRRTALEMPDASTSAAEPEPVQAAAQSASEPADKGPFQVEKEQIASFPGDWGPLRGKTVKIISVQESKSKATETGSQAKLEYAKSLFEREYAELTGSSTTAAGVVLVFDAEDGGMMAATLPVLQQWKAGALSDEALWRRCYFDPPEMFHAASTP